MRCLPKRRSKILAPGVEVQAKAPCLIGQENNARVAGALKRLGVEHLGIVQVARIPR